MESRQCRCNLAIVTAWILIVAGIIPLSGGQLAYGGTKDALPRKTGIPQVPGFAVRSRIPATGKQGPPGEAAAIIGNWQKGERLFVKNCQSCHGPRGTDNVPNPGSSDGTVPSLNPIDPDLASKDPSVFAANIDRITQHGSIPDGSSPKLFMPDWGDSKKLSQHDIADLEAYIMHLNGVARK
jgi:mono/diheme cytochrome c family protein